MNYGLSVEQRFERIEALEALEGLFNDLTRDNLLGLFIKADRVLALLDSILVNCLNAGIKEDLWEKRGFLCFFFETTTYVPRHKQNTKTIIKTTINIINPIDALLVPKIVYKMKYKINLKYIKINNYIKLLYKIKNI